MRRCPDCGSGEVFPVEVNQHRGGSVIVRLRDNFAHKTLALTTLVCADCGYLRQYVADDPKTRKHLARALMRPADESG
ncbi:hypothetical protein ACFWR9_06025 [Streptomyces sp. NPDC058534]|uniref:hypothetical protein n=1 Tax=Streptomyces sp. NPDC058534 TaxID=3346541 RepID=UPI00364E2111